MSKEFVERLARQAQERRARFDEVRERSMRDSMERQRALTERLAAQGLSPDLIAVRALADMSRPPALGSAKRLVREAETKRLHRAEREAREREGLQRERGD